MPTLVTPATMLRVAFASSCLFALCGLIGACVPQAKADAIADFYRARTVSAVVSSSAAGGYDTLARVVARYMGRHLPGNPVFIVRNMPGAGGIAATHFLYNNVDRDMAASLALFRTTRHSSRSSAPRRHAMIPSSSIGSA